MTAMHFERRVRYQALCLLAAAAAPSAAFAGLYKCIVNGQTTYTDAPCASSEARQSGRMDNKPVIFVGKHNGLSGGPSMSETSDPLTPVVQKTVDAATQRVKGILKDPDSAQFQNVLARGSVVCGQVNAKNSFGGYTGFDGFLVDEKNVVLAESNKSQKDRSITALLYDVLAKQHGCAS